MRQVTKLNSDPFHRVALCDWNLHTVRVQLMMGPAVLPYQCGVKGRIERTDMTYLPF